MSSMLIRLFATGLILSSTAALSAASSMAMAQTLSPDQQAWYRAQIGAGSSAPRSNQSNATADALVTWYRLRQSDAYSFSEYANFLTSYPNWPGDTAMRKVAEKAINPDSFQPSQVVAYFERLPALTTTGELRYALALSALGRKDAAITAARRAWIGGSLTPDDEGRVLSKFGSSLTSADHDMRMDKLLWDAATNSAARQLGLTSPAKRDYFAARLAMQSRASDAAAKADGVNDRYRNDPGYIMDRAGWLRNSGQSVAARALLAAPRALTGIPLDAEEWYETLLTNARGAANDQQWSIAYSIASQVDDAYPGATDVSDRPIGERDDYTSLVWLAGTAAMQQLGRPADAIGMFRRYALAARSPQTRSKGFYWAGRAALSAGKRDDATGYFRQAADYPDQFYGQLARERMGQPITPPPIDSTMQSAPRQLDLTEPTRLLGQMDAWKEQTLFIRAIAQLAKSDEEHNAAIRLSSELRRPDLAVMIGRSARLNGHNDYVRAGYPVVTVPGGYEANFTMIHAIARQESQFDREAVSHAGARGLMQLMPGTARETAGKIGLSYDLTGLVKDPLYNIQLGSTYFNNMLTYFGGSYPLAVAAYNAGPGNVNKWIRANGDPRMSGVDMIDWIENIPIYETRNYVQRVLENAVVYDAIFPDRARARGTNTPLSWYLGKRVPG